ncbi:hypothetical protein M885DRAFT_547172 [Pelagophyceae sp. CCMP2097]|nr:hypothetical protein M885DRAFT_547172 [Pelagophyceae sp. CCMP2097]
MGRRDNRRRRTRCTIADSGTTTAHAAAVSLYRFASFTSAGGPWSKHPSGRFALPGLPALPRAAERAAFARSEMAVVFHWSRKLHAERGIKTSARRKLTVISRSPLRKRVCLSTASLRIPRPRWSGVPPSRTSERCQSCSWPWSSVTPCVGSRNWIQRLAPFTHMRAAPATWIRRKGSRTSCHAPSHVSSSRVRPQRPLCRSSAAWPSDDAARTTAMASHAEANWRRSAALDASCKRQRNAWCGTSTPAKASISVSVA